MVETIVDFEKVANEIAKPDMLGIYLDPSGGEIEKKDGE